MPISPKLVTGQVVAFHPASGGTFAALVFETLDDEDTVSLVYVTSEGRVEKHQGVRRKGAPERRYEPTEYELAKLQRIVEDERKAAAEEYKAFITRPMGSAAGTWEP